MGEPSLFTEKATVSCATEVLQAAWVANVRTDVLGEILGRKEHHLQTLDLGPYGEEIVVTIDIGDTADSEPTIWFEWSYRTGRPGIMRLKATEATQDAPGRGYELQSHFK